MRAVLILLALLFLHAVCPAQGIDPNVRMRIDGVAVDGNRITKERIILRELLLHEGDSVTATELYARIERSTQNLRNLSLFNSVSIMPLFLSERNVFLTVTVNERWYWWPELIFKVADPNFNTWWLTRDFRRVNWGAYLNRYNFRGLNETLYLKFQFGYTKEFGLRYRIPFIDARQRWGISVGAAYAEQNEVTVATIANKRVFARFDDREVRTERKADVQVTLRRAHDRRHMWRLGYVHAMVDDTVRRATNDYFRGGGLRSGYFTFGYGFSIDRRDSKPYPLKGMLIEIGLERLGLGIAGEAEPDVTLATTTITRHWKPATRWSLGASIRARTAFSDDIPYFNQEGLGYGTYVRGYEYYIIDGQHAAAAKANVLFALLPPREYYLEPIPMEAFRTLYLAVYLNAFVDVGHAWDDRYAAVNPLANTWLTGYGLGLDVVTSYDQVIRLEVARNGLAENGFYLHFSHPF